MNGAYPVETETRELLSEMHYNIKAFYVLVDLIGKNIVGNEYKWKERCLKLPWKWDTYHSKIQQSLEFIIALSIGNI